MVNFVDWIPIFEWYMTRLGVSNGQQQQLQQHILCWNWTMCTKYNDHIKVNREQN